MASNEDEGNGFKMKMSEYRGYTLKALEDLNEETKEINSKIDALRKEDIKDVKDDIKKFQEQLTLLRIKTAGIGLGSGGVGGLIIFLISKLIGGG